MFSVAGRADMNVQGLRAPPGTALRAAGGQALPNRSAGEMIKQQDDTVWNGSEWRIVTDEASRPVFTRRLIPGL